jgi:hypothetical protein
MKQFIKTLTTAAAVTVGTVMQAAAAQTCLPWPLNSICVGQEDPAPGGGGSILGAPEIDVTQGFAAVAILVVAALILRERFLRQRTKA